MENIFKTKCPYVDCCTLYDAEGCTCNETGGDYYGPGRMAGCGREITMKGKRAYCYKEPSKESVMAKENREIENVIIGLGCVVLCLLGVGMYFLIRAI